MASASVIGSSSAARPELSVVMPCLDEADTLATCIRKAQKAMSDYGIDGEIVVADNGSTDGSPSIAAELGARVVNVPARGYGRALLAGITAAEGRFILMADADDSYDLLQLPRLQPSDRAPGSARASYPSPPFHQLSLEPSLASSRREGVQRTREQIGRAVTLHQDSRASSTLTRLSVPSRCEAR
jgi:GT2 family glycosyltransferase